MTVPHTFINIEPLILTLESRCNQRVYDFLKHKFHK